MSGGSYSSTEAKLEFPAILRRLSSLCRFSVAAERALEIGPSSDPSHVRYLLDVTSEAVDILTNLPDLTVGGARDIRELVERAEKGSRVQPTDLLQILDTVESARTLRRAFYRVPDVDDRFPLISEFIVGLADLPGLEADINRSISVRGDVMDTASDELGRIRRAIRVAHSRLTQRLNSMVTGGKYATVIQDSIITSRDGRYVIPIKAEARSQVPGIVHDTSASGQTLFIEPMEIVELNNKWREEQLAEQREVDRVLDALSYEVGKQADALNTTVDALAAFDLALAKAKMAVDQKATRPHIWSGGDSRQSGHASQRVVLHQARHPLIDPSMVVPIDIEVGVDFRVLLITGPNTGGKTVALKTVGLLQLMAQTGLFISAGDGSIVSVFPAIYVDIGDEQSIAQSLSTFSAHMRNVIAMLRDVDAESLVLLDELGAGTDPEEGSALARALIAELLDRGPLVIATTHYSEVKAFAYATPGAENASVEFDVQTLAPTYRLTIGVPGRSNAIAIARRLGLPSSILDRAQELVDPENVRADTLLEDIRRRRDEAEEALKRAQDLELETGHMQRETAAQLREAESARQVARDEALAAAQQELDEVRQALRRLERDRDTISVSREHVAQRRDEVDQAAATVREFRRKQQLSRKPTNTEAVIKPGDRVLVISLGEEADVLSVENGQADLQIGALKLRQPVDVLRRLGRAKTETQVRPAVKVPSSPGFVPMEIDIRGQRVSEIGDELENYLVAAYQSGLPMVRIIHGKGTGALRQVVRDFLHKSPIVARAETAAQNEGGDGATVAYFRET